MHLVQAIQYWQEQGEGQMREQGKGTSCEMGSQEKEREGVLQSQPTGEATQGGQDKGGQEGGAKKETSTGAT
jgi:hypothetical protein